MPRAFTCYLHKPGVLVPDLRIVSCNSENELPDAILAELKPGARSRRSTSMTTPTSRCSASRQGRAPQTEQAEALNSETSDCTRPRWGVGIVGVKMTDPGGTPNLDFNMGRLSVLMELVQHLGQLQGDEQANVDRFEGPTDIVLKLAMSECMTRMMVIGDLLDWANLKLGQAQLEPKLAGPPLSSHR